MPASRWDDQSFAFSGELVGGQVLTVCWDDSVFDPSGANPIVVGTELAIAEALSVDPSVELIGPHADGDKGTEEVSVRGAVYVPPPFVPLVMHGDLTPRQAWDRLGGGHHRRGEASRVPIINGLAPSSHHS